MIPLSIPSPDPIFRQFMIGPLTIHTYAICILAGIILAIIITQRRMSARGATQGIVLDVIIWAVPFGIVGARFYHVLTHTGDYFAPGDNLWNTLAIWDGGNALYGSLIGGAVGAYIGCRRHGIKLWSFADALAPAMLVAQATGRLGNWFNQELFGLPTTLPWGLQIARPNIALTNDHLESLRAGTLFQPLFLYEIIWNLIGVAIIILLERRLRGHGSELRWGKAFGVYLIWYGLGRSWLEAIRIDPTSDRILGLPDNVFASFVTVAVGVVLIVVQARRHQGKELSVYRDDWVPKPDKPAGSDRTAGSNQTADAAEVAEATDTQPERVS